MASRQVFDTIRLNPREIRSILNENEPDETFDETSSKRVARRWTMGGRKILVTIQDDSGTQQHFLSVIRDLSATGISFLHGGYLHTGSKCKVTLPTVGGGDPKTVDATIMRCRHMEKHLHDIGVRFDLRIDPRQFIDFGNDHVFTLERVHVEELRGTLLVVEDSRMFQKLIASYFNGSNLDLEFVQEGKAALDFIDQLPDMIFTDLHLPDMDGLDLIEQIRTMGYGGPIILLTADTTPGLRKKAVEAGANEMLLKPVPPALLHQAAAEYLLTSKLASSAQAQIISTADTRTMNRELIADYIEDLQKKAKELASLIEVDGELDKVRQLVTHLKASASGFGFEPISDAASETLKSLDATGSVGESKTVLLRLSMACRRAAPPLSDEDVMPNSPSRNVKGAA